MFDATQRPNLRNKTNTPECTELYHLGARAMLAAAASCSRVYWQAAMRSLTNKTQPAGAETECMISQLFTRLPVGSHALMHK